MHHQSDPVSLNHLPRQHQFFYLLLAIIALSIFVLPRFIHLDADPRSGFIPIDTGYKIDEGYKTFGAKNLLVFGKTPWHPSDTYSGWMKKSPGTQWPYYYAFKTLGLELKNARLISAIYFVLFIALAFYFLNRRYTIPLALTGIFLLACDPALFYFSRSALFETAIILFVYAGILFITTRIYPDKPLKAIIAMMAMMLLTSYTIKQSAVIYFFPPIVASTFMLVFNTVHSRWKKNAIYITALLLAVLLFTQAHKFHSRFDVDVNQILRFPKAFFVTNPMLDLTPLALLLGYACILHLLLVNPKSLYDNIYRLSLASIVVAGPVILVLIKYHPPRYFVPIIPAYILLSIEWLHLKPWKLSMRDRFTSLQKFTITVFIIIFSLLLLRVIHIFILRNLPFTIGEHTVIDKLTLYKLLPLFLLVVFGFYYMLRGNIVRILGYSIPLLILASSIVGVSSQTMALLHPSYDSQTIRSALNRMVAETESIAGDWAPFFTAEAPIRSFYMNDAFNFPDPQHIDKIRPDYFLSSNTPSDKNSQSALESNGQIQLSEPQMIGSYMNHDVSIHRIKYLNSK